MDTARAMVHSSLIASGDAAKRRHTMSNTIQSFEAEELAIAAAGSDPHAYVVEGTDGLFYIEPNAEKAAARLLIGRARYGVEEQTIALDLAYSVDDDSTTVPVLYQRDV